MAKWHNASLRRNGLRSQNVLAHIYRSVIPPFQIAKLRFTLWGYKEDDAILNAMAALIFCALILARRQHSGHEKLHSQMKSVVRMCKDV